MTRQCVVLLTLLSIIGCVEAQPCVDCNKQMPPIGASDQSVDLTKKSMFDKRKFFPIALYKANYVLPYYYTASPYVRVYRNHTPDDQPIQRAEVKFQFSLKVPVVTNLLHRGIAFYIAYTQLSYWQAYADSAFFRETNYEPEFFFEWPVDRVLYKNWELPFLNFGAVHQSNGQGGGQERSWNRLYAEAFIRNGNFVISLKPWYIVPASVSTYNPNLSDYLGHGRALLAYQFHHQVFSLELRNDFESGFHRGAQQLSWSIPITKQLKFYVQYFHGYGQSLIEYDHSTNAGGVGISFNDELAGYFPDEGPS